MKQFIQRFSDKITGVLSGFDRLILRGSLRPISYPYGMKGFLWLNQVMLKDFCRYVDSVSKQLRTASCQALLAQQRLVVDVHPSRSDKEDRALQIAAKGGITCGLIGDLAWGEPCSCSKAQRSATAN